MTGIARPMAYWLAWGLLFACGATPSAPENGEESSTVVLSWNRDGGFAGFCDELKVSAVGDAAAATCRTQGIKTRKLPTEDRARLDEWRRTFGAVSITSGDPGSADSMTLKLTLAGKGSDQPSAAQRQEMLDWAQRVYTQTID
jgi:hypothetical protein